MQLSIFVGEKVFHKIYGEGTVIDCDGSHLDIDFNGESKRLNLEFVIANSLISFENTNLNRSIRDYLKERLPCVKGESFEEINSLQNIMAKKKLLTKLHELGFEGFLHTTEINNFIEIVSSGYLYSRERLNLANVYYRNSADISVLHNTRNNIKNMCRFYYYFKTPTVNEFFRRNPCNKYVIMVFDENLIYNDNCRFTNQNAAKHNTLPTRNAERALEYHWEGVFERGYYKDSAYYDDEKESSIHDITGMRNAEFLFPNEVSVDKIVKVYFSCEYHKNIARKYCPQELIDKFCVDGSKF